MKQRDLTPNEIEQRERLKKQLSNRAKPSAKEISDSFPPYFGPETETKTDD